MYFSVGTSYKYSMFKFKWEMKSCLIGYIITIIAALAMLWLSTFLPQDAIESHVRDSVKVFDKEGHYGRIGDYEASSQMDSHTDALIFLASLVTHSGQSEAILTNPMYGDPANPREALSVMTQNEDIDYSNPGWNYVRYWMGFRAPMRLLLTKLDYAQIRTYIGYVLFGLMAMVACVVARYTDLRVMFMFMLSFILVKPQVICNSIQFSCCFFLALLFMLGIPYIQKNRKWEVVYFMESGMMTMFFDFYTSPIIVFGYPMVFLCMIDIFNSKELKVIRIIKNAFIWLGGYAMMWIAKLMLTTALSDYNALQDGIASLIGRLGIEREEGLEEYYSISLAFKSVFETILPNREDRLLAVGLLSVFLMCMLLLIKKKKVMLSYFRKHSPILVLAVIPLIWFAVTAQPTSIHAFFQYRNIALTYWAFGGYICSVLGMTYNAKY